MTLTAVGARPWGGEPRRPDHRPENRREETRAAALRNSAQHHAANPGKPTSGHNQSHNRALGTSGICSNNERTTITCCQPTTTGPQGHKNPQQLAPGTARSPYGNKRHQALSARHQGAERPSSVQLKSQRDNGQGREPEAVPSVRSQPPSPSKKRETAGCPGGRTPGRQKNKPPEPKRGKRQTARPPASGQGKEPNRNTQQNRPQGGTTTRTPSPERTRKGCPASARDSQDAPS